MLCSAAELCVKDITFSIKLADPVNGPLEYEMRNALAHGCFNVDIEIVWTTIERDLPELVVLIRDLLNNQL